jgi:hypothetical protein
MINKKASQNDVLLAIRMPKKLLDQLNALAQAKGVGTSTMARMTLIDYLKEEAPNALIGASTPTKPSGKPTNPARAIYEALSPAERQAYDDDWNY